MSDNKKIPTSSSFLKRNFFIIVFITVLVIGGVYLYLNNNYRSIPVLIKKPNISH